MSDDDADPNGKPALGVDQAVSVGVFENFPSAVVIKSIDGRYIYANRLWRDWFNPENRPLLGRSVFDFYPLDHAEEITSHDQIVIKENAAQELEVETPFPDGSVRTTFLQKFPIHDDTGAVVAVGGINTDISDRTEALRQAREAEAEATAARALISNAIESIEGGVALFDAENRLVLCNADYRENLHLISDILVPGTPIEAIIRGALESGMFAASNDAPEETYGRQIRAFYERAEISVHTTDPEQVFAVKFLKAPGGGTLILRTDVTELYRAERDAVAARKEADAANQAKSEFLASMSHEIRTPMTGVLGLSDMLLKTDMSDDQVRLVNSIQTSARGLMGIINDILDQSKIGAGRLTLEVIDFDLEQVTGQVVSNFNPRAVEKNLWFTVDVASDIPPRLRGDPTRLRQILFNLIDNALKFTAEGGVTTTVAKQDGDWIAFRVEDTGEGVPPEAQDQLFERFQQADASTSRRYGGSGLGLSITKSLVELMGGELGFESQPGAGSTFWFRVPLPAAETAPGAPADRDASIAKANRALQVLIAEDNQINQMIIQAAMAELGHHCLVVENGKSAVEQAATGSFDLVLMDIRMPEMDGIEALERIRALDGRAAAVPVVALTADVTEDRVQEYGRAGFNAIAGKPIDGHELVRAINLAMGETIHG